MNWQEILSMAWTFMNSGPGMILIGSIAVAVLNRIYKKFPKWKKYQGIIITAIRKAEKSIPDDTPSAGMRRFDMALRFVIDLIEIRENREVDRSEVAEISEGIRLMHNEIEDKISNKSKENKNGGTCSGT